MTSIDDARLEEMLAAAREVRARAYVPYSGFHVGAALLAGDEIFTAVNVENASYPLSVCAERNAIAKAVAAGSTDIRAVAVVSDADSPTPPCGGILNLRAISTSTSRRTHTLGGFALGLASNAR